MRTATELMSQLYAASRNVSTGNGVSVHVKWVLAALVPIVGLLTTGCFGGSSASRPASVGATTSRSAPSVIVARSSAPVRVSGGTERERALLRRVIDRSGVSAVVAAHLGGPSGGFHQPGLWLRLTVAVPSPNKAQAIPLLWQAELVEGAYRALSVSRGLPDLARVVYQRRLPTGKTLAWAAGVAAGNAPTTHASQVFPTRRRITTHVMAAAKAAGWKLRRIALFRPDGFAAEVTLVATRPQSFGNQLTAFQRHAQLPGMAGMLIEVQNPCGATVYREAHARWVGMYTSSANPRWLCPNPAASLPAPCPPSATRACGR